jgi:molecular chaperone DnaK (HSP70)
LTRRASLERLPCAAETIEAAISVPANASSARRLLTLDAFVAAGFPIVALLNEPSAASNTRTGIAPSVLRMTGHENEAVISEGIQRLGGDDFDEAIVDRGQEQ